MAVKAKTSEIPYNNRVLEWSRKRAGMAVEDVAKRISVAAQKVIDWEAGTAKPTTRQGRMLAASYDRHFLEFFSENIPDFKEVDLIPDFRAFKAKKAQGEKEKRTLEGVQEWAEEQRLNALALIEELGDLPPVLSDNLRFEIDADVDVAAEISREAMGFGIAEQLSLKKSIRYTFPEILRDKIEAMGVKKWSHSFEQFNSVL